MQKGLIFQPPLLVFIVSFKMAKIKPPVLTVHPDRLVLHPHTCTCHHQIHPRQIDRQIDGQIDRQIDRQQESNTYTTIFYKITTIFDIKNAITINFLGWKNICGLYLIRTTCKSSVIKLGLIYYKWRSRQDMNLHSQ